MKNVALKVLVWDEQQEAQKKAYANYLGNHLAEYLGKQADLEVRSASIRDPEQGLSDEALDWAEVVIWWGHQKHGAVANKPVERLVRRILDGSCGFVPVHSSHYAKPFKAIMYERLKQNVLRRLPEEVRGNAEFVKLKEGAPDMTRVEARDGKTVITVIPPMCGLGGVRGDGLPSHVEVKAPDHPIAKGIPAKFDIKQTEMYNEVFTVPDPDTVVFFESWDNGEKFRAGCCWNVGKGRVFYFRPGHETFPVFHQEETLRIVYNAALWAGNRT